MRAGEEDKGDVTEAAGNGKSKAAGNGYRRHPGRNDGKGTAEAAAAEAQPGAVQPPAADHGARDPVKRAGNLIWDRDV